MRNAGVNKMISLNRCCFVNKMSVGINEVKPSIMVKQFPEMFN
jgi:hypothetical protein